jgi:type II secretory pathway pseudopilin PulG
MLPISHRPARAITLAEILVVISILGLLLALLLPAVQRARGAALRIECAKNLQQLGVALHAYQSAHSFFPPSYGAPLVVGRRLSLREYSVHTQILPFIDEKNLYNNINFQVEARSGWNGTAIGTRVALFLCPSDGFNFRDSSAGPNSYRANHGTGPFPTKASTSPESGNGAFCALPSCLSPRDYVDGLEYTAAISEKRRGDGDDVSFTPETDGFLLAQVGAPSRETLRSWCEAASSATLPHYSDAGLTWTIAGPRNTWYNHIEPPNAPLPDCAWRTSHPETGIFTARSQHPGGVNVLFASGTVRFISQNVDLSAWRAIGSRNGNETIDSHTF